MEILIAWKSTLFTGTKTFRNNYAVTMDFFSMHDNTRWVLTCIYAPCTNENRAPFFNWFRHMHIPAGSDWIILGDFNLIRKNKDRNMPGGDLTNIFNFNAAISQLGITEIVLEGRKFTWSTMRPSPLLEKLDWVFTSGSWALNYPSTSVKALDMIPSDHCPCIVSISTQIPRNKTFRFENHWLKHSEFQNILSQSWNDIVITDKARLITAKLKRLRKKLREWHASMASLKTLIVNVRETILFLEILVDYRDLGLFEWNFKKLLERHLLNLLDKQRQYWQQRGNVNWVKLGDASTHFFHANATIRHRNNLITELVTGENITVNWHSEKELLLWEEYKHRLGENDFRGFIVNINELIQRNGNLQHLEAPFSNEEIDRIIKGLPNFKSPGPDGFNNEFLKGSWATIKQDFYELCYNFHNNNCCLQSINSSYITLIPKIENARTVNDFRPISLLNSSIKLLTKLLANRLQSSITTLVHKNFIKKRTIQDCLAWAFEYLHLCH